MNINVSQISSAIKLYKRHLIRKLVRSQYKLGFIERLFQYNFPAITLTPDLTSKSLLLYGQNNEVPKSARQGVPTRGYASGGPPSRRLPPLMKFPEIVWPSIVKTIRNFILTNFIIKPYLDAEFNLSDFITGSKKAVEVVSKKLSDGEINELDGLVAGEALPDLQHTISRMSLSQRQQIAISQEDIYFSFPYQVGIMFDDEEGKEQKRFVEITMVYHCLHGLQSLRNSGEDPPLNMGLSPQYRDLISICNYRFIREFTKGVEDDWTVNLLNHFKPSDYVE